MKGRMAILAAGILAACAPASDFARSVGLEPMSGSAQSARDAELQNPASATEGTIVQTSAATHAIVPDAPGRIFVEVDDGTSTSAQDSSTRVVAYAMNTTNPVGEKVYDRTLPSEDRTARACSGYLTATDAQYAFLEAGGPQRDRLGLDPDGDGFACSFNPVVYRRPTS